MFARTIYPSAGFRNFTDIDLLVAPEAEPQLARVLKEQGFELAEYDRDPDRQEWKWLHRDNDALMIEVHTNLAHHPELRRAISITYEDLAGIAETPAALLTVALVHGALERYELLRQVVDVCQAARAVDTTEEERRFEALVRQTGARFAAIAGLDLALSPVWRAALPRTGSRARIGPLYRACPAAARPLRDHVNHERYALLALLAQAGLPCPSEARWSVLSQAMWHA